MRTIDQLLDQYGESHQNATNKLIHWVCVPAIMFSLLGLIMCIPFPVEKSLFANWTAVFLALALAYYLRLSVAMFAGFIIIGGLMLLGNWGLYAALDFNTASLAIWSLAIFAVAWVGQFYGHKIEGKKPSFLKDVQFLLIGPVWLMHFVYKRVGVKY